MTSNKGLEWTNLILGAGLACAAITLTGLPVAARNAGIVGVLIMCCSAIAPCRYGATDWSNPILGCWTVAAPFLLGFGSAQTPMWTHVVLGLCVASIATVQFSPVAGRTRLRAPGPPPPDSLG